MVSNLQKPIQTEHEEPQGAARGYEAFQASLRESYTKRGKRRKKTKKYWSKWKNRVSGLTLLFVAGYTIITFNQLKVARDQEQRQLRAYLVFESPIMHTNGDRAPDGELVWSIGAHVKNSGQTPAVQVRTLDWIQVVPRTINKIDLTGLNQSHFGQAVGVVGAGGSTGAASIGLNAGVFIDQFENKVSILFANRLSYKDVFGVPHETRLCFFISMPNGVDPNLYSRTRKFEGIADSCPIGNCTDHDCDNQPNSAPAPQLGPIRPPPIEAAESIEANRP